MQPQLDSATYSPAAAVGERQAVQPPQALAPSSNPVPAEVCHAVQSRHTGTPAGQETAATPLPWATSLMGSSRHAWQPGRLPRPGWCQAHGPCLVPCQRGMQTHRWDSSVLSVVKNLCEQHLSSCSATDVTLVCSVCLVLPTANSGGDAWAVLPPAQTPSSSLHTLKQGLDHAESKQQRTCKPWPAWASHPQPDPEHVYPWRQRAAFCRQATERSRARF